VSPSKRLFGEQKQRALLDDEQLTASQAYGVVPQREYMERSGQSVVQITTNLELRKHVERDDFVISMRSFQGGLERAWATGCIRSSYVVLRPSRRVEVGYYTHLFKSHAYIQALQATSHFIRDGQDLNFGNFSLVDLPLPPEAEQREIATFLDRKTAAIDDMIAKKERLIQLLMEKRQALITQAVTKGLDLNVPRKDSGVVWLGGLPAHWAVAPLKQRTVLVARGRSPDYSEQDDGIPIINQACVYWTAIRYENVKWQRRDTMTGERGRLRKGDLLMNSTGTGTLGRVAVFEQDGEYLADSHVTVIRTAESAAPAFLRYVLQTDTYQGYVYSVLAPGATNQIELSREGLRRTPFPFPPLKEQHAIAGFLDRKTRTIDALNKHLALHIERLREYRQRLVTDAVTGKIDVSKEVA